MSCPQLNLPENLRTNLVKTGFENTAAFFYIGKPLFWKFYLLSETACVFLQRKLFSAVIMENLLIFKVIAVRQKQLLWIKKVFQCILLQYTKHPKIAQFMRDNFMERKKHIMRRNVL